MASVDEQLRELLQKFVEARIDAPMLFARAGEMFPPGADATEQLLQLLAESEIVLSLPQDRSALARRIEQVAGGETSYTELDLWFFILTQIKEIDSDAPSEDSETELLRTIVAWSQEWDDEQRRPSCDTFREFAAVLRQAPDPSDCLQQLEEVLARGERG